MNWSGEGLPMDLDDELMIQSPVCLGFSANSNRLIVIFIQNVTFVDPPMPRPMSLIPRSSGYIVDESGQNQNYTTDRPTLQVGSIQSGLGTVSIQMSYCRGSNQSFVREMFHCLRLHRPSKPPSLHFMETVKVIFQRNLKSISHAIGS